MYTDGVAYAKIGAGVGTSVLDWRVMVTIPVIDYSEFVVYSLAITGAGTGILMVIAVILVVKAYQVDEMESIPDKHRGLKSVQRSIYFCLIIWGILWAYW